MLLKLKFPQGFKSSNKITAMFHNVRSLNKHLIDISHDRAFTKSDVLILVETSKLKDDPLFLEKFTLFLTRDCKTRKEHFGNAVFIRKSIFQNNNITKIYDNAHKKLIEVDGILINNNFIIYIYNKINAPFNELKKMIFEAISTVYSYEIDIYNILIIGDFKINLKNISDKLTMKIVSLMTTLNMIQITPLLHSSITTDSQIDFCFSQKDSIQAYYYESIFSDHKAIWFQV